MVIENAVSYRLGGGGGGEGEAIAFHTNLSLDGPMDACFESDVREV